MLAWLAIALFVAGFISLFFIRAKGRLIIFTPRDYRKMYVSVFLFGMTALSLLVEFAVSYQFPLLVTAVFAGLVSLSILQLGLLDRERSIKFLREQKLERDMAKLDHLADIVEKGGER